jgi:hypothetical protein
LVRMEPSDAPVFELLDPLGWLVDSVAQRDEEVGDSSVVFNVPVGGAFEYVFIVFDSVVEPGDLLLEATDLNIFMGVASGDGCEESFDDGSEDIGVEVRVCRQCVRNGIGRHRWFRTLDGTDRERDAVLGGQGVGRIGRCV